jgi:hypothetical protein
VQVGVGTNDDWIPSNLTFLYYPAVTVTRVQPSSAQIERGELVVTVTGSWFMEKESLSCVFGLRSVTQASYISSSCVLCTLTSQGRTGMIELSVKMNGVAWGDSGSSIGIWIHTGMKLVRLSPSTGPSKGGTQITVTADGMGLAPGKVEAGSVELWFGSLQSDCGEWSDGHVYCTVPRITQPVSLPWITSVIFTAGGVSSRPATFEYFSVAQVVGLSPSRGNVLGGGAVTVTGRWFRSDGLACRFGGSMAISVKYLSSTAVACIAPPAVHLVEAEVELSFNGGADFTEDSKRYIYEQGVTVTQIWPSHATLRGEGWQTVVTVLGSHFQDREDLSCRYGLNSIVKGGYTSSTAVVCHVPAENVGNLSVTVSSNGGEFSWTSAPLVVIPGSIAYTSHGPRNILGTRDAGGGGHMDEEVRLVSFWPASISAWGATEVNMYGKGFGHHTDACWVGGVLSEIVLVSSTHTKCLLNSQSPGLVSLEVGGKNADWGPVAGLEMEVTEPLVLDSLSPSQGWAKGALITVKGNG